MQFTGVEADEAMVALHDCDNDVNAAIDALLEGDDQGKWLESTKKKKKPTTTKPTEAENNKENRRLDSRERSSSRPRGGGPPRFRGRGGGSNRGGRESDGWDGPGRGEGSRRGRMTNGTSVTRGRGGRGRGGSVGPRTFQNRQAPGFPDSIDTWGPVTEDKPNHQNNLKIDNWDDEPPASSDDWDSEWTGSLEETTVFCPSSSSVATNITPVLSESLPDPMAVGSASVGSAVSLAPTPVYVTTPQSYAPSTTATYSSASVSTYSSATSSTASITQPQTMDLVSLLQKAAPQSTLSGLVPPSSLGGTNNNNSVSGGATLVSPAPGLNVGGQHGILAGLNTNVGESLKAGSLVGSVAATVPSPASSAPPPYSSPTAQLQAAIFSNSGLHSGVSSSLASSISNSSNSVINNKSVSLSTVSSSLPSRPKTQRPRIPQASKIPLSAVEMPEDAMAALDVQFSGLEFGAETFDFTAEVKTSSSTSCGVNTTPISSRDPSTPPATKDLTSASLASPLSQTQKNSYSTTNQQGGSGVSSSNSTVYSNTNSGSTGTNSNNSSSSQGGYGSSFSVQASGAGSSNGQYQNSYANASSHSSLGSITAPKTLTGLSTSPAVKDATQSFGEQTSTGASGLSSTLSTSATVSSNVTSSTGSAVLSATLNSAPTLPVQPSKPSVPGKVISSLGGTVPPGVPHHQPHMHQQQVQQHQAQHQQQQQQQQHQQQMMAQHSQYVSPPAAALQGALPPAFYTGLQQPTMYSLEDFQLLQQRMPHMQAPTSLATGREGNITSAAYSAADAKFRTDQNSSPVPSTMNQQVGQGAQAGGTYITATGNAAMPPFYMYHNMAAVPSSFPQYGAPTAIIQIPPVTNAHTGSTTNQFPAAPKLQYGTGNYYDNITQTQDFKTGYGTASQNQTKGGGATTGSATNSGSDLGGYKNHLKMGRSYDKQGFHTGTPPPFNLAGSGTNPMTANAYTPMFIPTMPAAQHHSPLMHHQLHQDGASSGGQRAATTGGQNKGGSKPSYGGSYWGTN
ncbi:ubiquitin-associated protein 2-like isoform X6 [Macrobrachium nipponense]|uniref:ubiquitin-associated protein 2-like isoform X6 n=1 Tax=Macrobrachium nipponense TaxID=159736 RepID=UPI0030C7CDEE